MHRHLPDFVIAFQSADSSQNGFSLDVEFLAELLLDHFEEILNLLLLDFQRPGVEDLLDVDFFH